MARHAGGAGLTVSDRFERALQQAQETVRDAATTGTPLRIVGAGSWLYGGRPVDASQRLDTRGLAGVRAYTPGDLVITVGAGTTLGDIASVTGEHGQWLALDPVGDDSTTIGAAIATGSSGSLALGAGRIRDLLLGVACIDGTGTVIRAGAPVVKNVAGFDLVRLAVGAFGTLGVITEASFRLHARPAVDESFVVRLPAAGAINPALERLGTSALSFQALELLDTAMATRVLGAGSEPRGDWVLLARATGNPDRVRALRSVLASVGDVTSAPAESWPRLRRAAVTDAVPHGAIVARITGRPSSIADTIADVERTLGTTRPLARMHATPHAGTVRVVMEHDVANAMSPATFAALRATVVFEQLPAAMWAHVPGAARDPISRRIRSAFDPRTLLNPGVLGELSGADRTGSFAPHEQLDVAR